MKSARTFPYVQSDLPRASVGVSVPWCNVNYSMVRSLNVPGKERAQYQWYIRTGSAGEFIDRRKVKIESYFSWRSD
jgi:hypothetical protein